MPRAWSKKDERQYKHIVESEAKEGRSAQVAKRIAAATVNKQRVKEGRAKTAGGSKGRAGARAGRSRATRSS